MAWTNPSDAGTLDLATGGTVTETVWDGIRRNLLVLGGTAGYVAAAALAADAGGVWVDWTPTLLQNGAVTYNPWYARYLIIGKLVTVIVGVKITGAGTAGSAIIIGGIPAAIVPVVYGAGVCVGAFTALDNGTTQYAGSVVAYAATALQFQCNVGSILGTSPAWTVANTDELTLIAQWQKA